MNAACTRHVEPRCRNETAQYGNPRDSCTDALRTKLTFRARPCSVRTLGISAACPAIHRSVFPSCSGSSGGSCASRGPVRSRTWRAAQDPAPTGGTASFPPDPSSSRRSCPLRSHDSRPRRRLIEARPRETHIDTRGMRKELPRPGENGR